MWFVSQGWGNEAHYFVEYARYGAWNPLGDGKGKGARWNNHPLGPILHGYQN